MALESATSRFEPKCYEWIVPLRAEPARHPIGRGWVWVRSVSMSSTGDGVSVAMVLIWFAVGLLLGVCRRAASSPSCSTWFGGRLGGGGRHGYEGNPLRFADFFSGFSPQADPADAGGLLVLALFSLIGLICLGLLSMWGLTSLLTQDRNLWW